MSRRSDSCGCLTYHHLSLALGAEAYNQPKWAPLDRHQLASTQQGYGCTHRGRGEGAPDSG
eukprot:3706436-Rhodomonas_salina.1